MVSMLISIIYNIFFYSGRTEVIVGVLFYIKVGKQPSYLTTDH